MEEEERINQELKDRLHLCQVENQILREEIKKQTENNKNNT